MNREGQVERTKRTRDMRYMLYHNDERITIGMHTNLLCTLVVYVASLGESIYN